MTKLLKKYVLDNEGNPLEMDDLLIWAEWLERTKDRHLAIDYLPNGNSVSTVFLGMDHNYNPEGPPVLWETMIFGGEQDGYQMRYSRKEDALEGHKKAVALAGGKIRRAIRFED